MNKHYLQVLYGSFRLMVDIFIMLATYYFIRENTKLKVGKTLAFSLVITSGVVFVLAVYVFLSKTLI